MKYIPTKILLLVISSAVANDEEYINKLDPSNTGVDELQLYVWYRQKDMLEIRNLISTIPYFKAIGGDDEEKYYEKFSNWYDANRNNFNQRRRDLETIEEKVNILSSYSESTTKNLQELNESDKLRYFQSMSPRWKDLNDRLHTLEESVMAARVVADEATRVLHAERGRYSLRDHDLLEAKAILEDEHEVAANRTRTIGTLQDRLQQVEDLFSNIKVKAEEILLQRAELQEKIRSVKERTSTTEAEIKKVTKKLDTLKKGETPASVLSTSVGGGLNYIKSVKTASGTGKRIKLMVVSD